MTIMTRRNEELLSKLVEIAGSTEVVEEALEELAASKGTSVRLEDLIRKIAELVQQRSQAEAAASR